MTFSTILLNIVLGFVLYLSNGAIGKYKTYPNHFFKYPTFGFDKIPKANFAGHFFQKIVHPAIYLAVVVAILQYAGYAKLARNMWLVVPAFWIFRFLHILIWDLISYTNWEYELLSLFLSNILGEGTFFFVLQPLLDEGESVFIKPTAFRDAFWFAVITYLAKKSWDAVKNSLYGERLFPHSARKNKFVKKYDKFKWKYGAYIEHILEKECQFNDNISRKRFVYLLYSIMIYEDHCRPKTIRAFEYVIKLFHRNSVMSLGIMQVQTTRIISSRTSIHLAIEKLYSVYSTEEGSSDLNNTISAYNRGLDYYNNVFTIYSDISDLLGYSD